MAKIKMDISEYETIKDKERLLREALERERELQSKLEQLNKEKIQALEDVGMKVVKVTKTEVHEFLLKRRVDETKVARDLFYILGVDPRYIVGKVNSADISTLERVFFEKVTSHSFPVTETTTHGLDEVKVEIREELERKIKKGIEENLANAANALMKNEELSIENRRLTDENERLVTHNNRLLRGYDDMKANVDGVMGEVVRLNAIRDILSDGFGLTGRGRMLREIIEAIKVTDTTVGNKGM